MPRGKAGPAAAAAPKRRSVRLGTREGVDEEDAAAPVKAVNPPTKARKSAGEHPPLSFLAALLFTPISTANVTAL
jgi:hypothetical protein